MSSRTYCAICATLFTVVALGHFTRILNGWPMYVGPIEFPMAVSWFGMVIPASLAAWGIRIAAGMQN